MALLLNVDCAFTKCSVALSNNEEVIAQETSITQKDHASFLQPAIKKIFAESGISLQQIDAIAVANGPGSYTGLRVGLASAKGICYALNKPLILLNTLDLLASAMHTSSIIKEDILYSPMIDARRMEVFTALYNTKLQLVKQPASIELDNQFLKEERTNYTVVFGGNGISKLEQLPKFKNDAFSIEEYSISVFVQSALKAFKNKSFADLAYSEPFYFKPVYINKS